MLTFHEGKANRSRRIWKIQFLANQIGTCTITNDGSLDDPYHTVYLKLNTKSRGKGFGWKSFAGVSLLSDIDLIYAEAAKKNKASIGALARAGFVDYDGSGTQHNCKFKNSDFLRIGLERFILATPPSFWVDFADFFSNSARSVIRTVLGAEIEKGHYVVEHLGLFMAVDSNGFAAIGFNPKACINLLKQDQIAETCRFIGTSLGYPECCRIKIEDETISDIDAYGELFSSTIADNSVLSISKYLEGKALISHIPCSPVCPKSIENAESVSDFLEEAGVDFCSQLPDLILAALD